MTDIKLFDTLGVRQPFKYHVLIPVLGKENAEFILKDIQRVLKYGGIVYHDPDGIIDSLYDREVEFRNGMEEENE